MAGTVSVDGGDGLDSLNDMTLVATAHITNIEIFSSGLPTYQEQGPGPITPSDPANPNFQPAAGAVSSLAIDPFNANIVYAGSVAGGIWVSVDGGTTWTPKSDQLPSLAIGAIAIAPRDNTGAVVDASTPRSKLVVYAGTGDFSSSRRGGLSIGLMRSTDGGDTWTVLAPLTLDGVLVNAVVPLDNGSSDPAAQTVLVSAVTGTRTGGVFASTTSGTSFTKVLSGSATDLIADPGVAGRVYAGIVGASAGVYRSDSSGAAGTWTVHNVGLDLTGDRSTTTWTARSATRERRSTAPDASSSPCSRRRPPRATSSTRRC